VEGHTFLYRADSSNFHDFTSKTRLLIAAVVFAFVDELDHLLQAFMLDRNDLLTHEPLHSFVAVGGSQGAPIVEHALWGDEFDRELLLHVLSCVQVPGIKGINEFAEKIYIEKNTKDREAFIFSLVDHLKLQIILPFVEEVFRPVVETELDGIVDLWGGAVGFVGEVDGGEGEGSIQVFVARVVGNLGVVFILGGEFEAEAGDAAGGPAGEDANGGLLLPGLAISAP
jgi:hypothetical protein